MYGLTATPVTNSPIEVFNMLSLVAPKEDFERMGVRTVDDFVRQFGAVEERDRTNVSNDIVRANTLIGFKNLQGLRNLFNKYVNIKTVEDVDDEIHVPNAVEKMRKSKFPSSRKRFMRICEMRRVNLPKIPMPLQKNAEEVFFNNARYGSLHN